MKLLLKISWRNLKRHKGKSFVIGLIIFVGAFIMTVGNGTIAGMNVGLQQNIVERFTGDIVVVSGDQEKDTVFFTPMGKSVEPIYHYNKIKTVLENRPEIKDFIPIGRGTALVLNPDGDPGMTLLLGVDYDKYQEMFNNNIQLESGESLKTGERGILIRSQAREDFLNFQNIWFLPKGDKLKVTDLPAGVDPKAVNVRKSIILMGFTGDSTSNDLEIPVKGIVKFRFLDQVWKHFNIVDMRSFKECMNYYGLSDTSTVLGEEDSSLLMSADDNFDNLFDESDKSDSNMSESGKGDVDINSIKSYLKKNNEKSDKQLDNDIYTFALIKLKNHGDKVEVIKKLNEIFKSKKINARAVSWESALGQLAEMTTIIKGALYGFVFFIFLVAIIVIVNTLSMAVIERTTEIATMRAIGSQKGFIGQMFFYETLILSFVFGGLGIVTGAIVIKILTFIQITSGDNTIIQLFFGGDYFHPLLKGGDVLVIVLQLLLVTLIAVIYPIVLARKIVPLEAIARD